MKLLIQPGDGIAPLLKGIQRAKRSVDIAIFRFSLTEIEAALTQAANRGVAVHALIAYTNRGGEKGLRKLEMRLLAEGVTVSRTANDLARHHGKYMIIDRGDLYLLAFTFTGLDIDRRKEKMPAARVAKKVAKAVVRELPSVASALQATANGVPADKVLRQTVREVLKQVIEQEAAAK